MLLRPSWARLESSWQHVADLAIFIVFFNGFLDIFEVPRPVLEASWHAWRHLGPLEELLKRLERRLSSLGGLLKRVEGILSALGAILVASWRFFLVSAHGTRIETALNAGGIGGTRWPERGEGGAFLAPVIRSKWSGLLI